MPEDMIDSEILRLGRERLRQLAEVPKLIQENGRLAAELAECKARAFNTPQYRDTVRRCCDACNEAADLRKYVDELRRENARLSGGGNPPVPLPLVHGGSREIQ